MNPASDRRASPAGRFSDVARGALAFVTCLSTIVALMAAVPAVAGRPDAKRVRSLDEIRNGDVIRQQWDLSCGAAAIATIFTYQLQRPVTERQVALAMLKRTSPSLVRSRLGFSLLDLKLFASTHGFAAFAFADMSLDDLDGLAPVIVPIISHGFSHFVIYRGRIGDRVLLADPAFGNRTLPAAVFQKAWAHGIGFIVFDPSNPHAPNRMGAPRELLLAPGVQAERAALAGG